MTDSVSETVKALVVDDSAVSRKLAMRFLRLSEWADFDFAEASGGEEALASLQSGHFDYLFLDWNMADMTGGDLLQRIDSMKELGQNLRIVVMTTQQRAPTIDDVIAKCALNAGYSRKPFDEVAVRKVLQEASAK